MQLPLYSGAKSMTLLFWIVYKLSCKMRWHLVHASYTVYWLIIKYCTVVLGPCAYLVNDKAEFGSRIEQILYNRDIIYCKVRTESDGSFTAFDPNSYNLIKCNCYPSKGESPCTRSNVWHICENFVEHNIHFIIQK